MLCSREPPPTEKTRRRVLGPQARAAQPVGVGDVPALVVHPGGQLGDIVAGRVALEVADLAEVVDRVRRVPRAAAGAQDEQAPAALAHRREALGHRVDGGGVQPCRDGGDLGEVRGGETGHGGDATSRSRLAIGPEGVARYAPARCPRPAPRRTSDRERRLPDLRRGHRARRRAAGEPRRSRLRAAPLPGVPLLVRRAARGRTSARSTPRPTTGARVPTRWSTTRTSTRHPPTTIRHYEWRGIARIVGSLASRRPRRRDGSTSAAAWAVWSSHCRRRSRRRRRGLRGRLGRRAIARERGRADARRGALDGAGGRASTSSPRSR